jgi:hypothetical protein
MVVRGLSQLILQPFHLGVDKIVNAYCAVYYSIEGIRREKLMTGRYVVSKDPRLMVIANAPMGETPDQVSLEAGPGTSISVPVEVFDQAAIAWIKERKLQGALGAPVGREFGSPDWDKY